MISTLLPHQKNIRPSVSQIRKTTPCENPSHHTFGYRPRAYSLPSLRLDSPYLNQILPAPKPNIGPQITPVKICKNTDLIPTRAVPGKDSSKYNIIECNIIYFDLYIYRICIYIYKLIYTDHTNCNINISFQDR